MVKLSFNKIRCYKFLATSFGVGYIPVAPGTFGALVGLIITYLFSLFFDDVSFQLIHIICIISSYLIGVKSCKELISQWGHDPSRIVIDETMGFWISVLFLPKTIYVFISAFILFRFFDIVKPLGIRSLDKLSSSHSVMLDDGLAGIYSNIILQILVYLNYL